jgi:hypothetical protein
VSFLETINSEKSLKTKGFKLPYLTDWGNDCFYYYCFDNNYLVINMQNIPTLCNNERLSYITTKNDTIRIKKLQNYYILFNLINTKTFSIKICVNDQNYVNQNPQNNYGKKNQIDINYVDGMININCNDFSRDIRDNNYIQTYNITFPAYKIIK